MVGKIFSTAISVVGVIGFIVGVTRGQYMEAFCCLVIFVAIAAMILVTTTDEEANYKRRIGK
jgi:hypothetical protein